MSDTQTYRVRTLPLQREVIDPDDGSKTVQGYKPGSKVELTEAEAKKYQHLIETEESWQSRQPRKTTTKKESK
ncbi:MAG: hypothetical protein AAGE96_05365 [Cyanobacteria bacterium P01_G01_bin.19]